ncbi:hypothetical protein PTSG_05124 [Salpingoeca rosetta]|uniref:Uncharacterized protein n=1 Tax=Salpingoeca rosetta (strain ATCC 50818 / BSB-021) TaxID=946362 RepID=F2UAK8_SALR5|nr:uncharacterized protein PTSG_05124 [Salpingoeca rosetta]EGD73424.1 hypothetical protein PTSG_05124 [Salpingoeca rosetta]|eukprot:XP_004993706.1 hypothetical protein PTSG_05124 [Salpingoeca rosetta]
MLTAAQRCHPLGCASSLLLLVRTVRQPPLTVTAGRNLWPSPALLHGHRHASSAPASTAPETTIAQGLAHTPVKMLFLNRERVVPVPEKATWLSSVVPGPYTTMRTIDGTCIVEFDRHIKRLVKAGQTVVSRIQGGKDEFKRELPNERALEVLANTGQLRDMVLEHIRASITCFHETVVLQGMRGEVEEALEKRITVLLNWGMSSDHEFVTCVNTAADGSCINTWVYVEELPPVPKAPVHVIIRRRPPEARMYEGKDSKRVISTLRSHSQDMGVEPSHDQQAVQ